MGGITYCGAISSFGVRRFLEIPIFNANRGEIAIARATRNLLAKEYAARVHEARSEIALELNRLKSSQARMRFLRDAVKSQASLVETYRIGLEQGHVDVLSYYQARRDLIETRISLSQTKAEIHASRLRIEALVGEPRHRESSGTKDEAGVHSP